MSLRPSLSWRAGRCRPQISPPSRPVPTTHAVRRARFISSSSSPDPAPSTSSVSANEISHFSALASSWWNPHGPSRLLHLMNPLRHDFIKSCLSSTSRSPSSKHTYLDIGCGGGIFATSAARLPNTSHVTAIDPSPEVIAVAKAHIRSDPALTPERLTFLNTSIETLSTHEYPGRPDLFDVVTLFEVIEHIDYPSSFLSSCVRYLKPGGWLVGSTIARHPISYITTKLIAEAPVIGVVPRGTHDWGKYINPSELQAWFSGDGESKWEGWRTQGVVYVPGLGWKEISGSERVGNYFFAVRKLS